MSRGSIGGHLATAILLTCAYIEAIFLSKIVGGTYNAYRQSKYKRKHSDSAVPFIEGSIPGEALEGWKSADEKRKAQEENYWFVTKWAAVGAAVGAIVAACLAFGAFIEARRQASAAEESNRPWLHVERVDASEVSITADEISAKIDIITKNIGHSVASNIRITAELTFPDNLNYIRTESLCTEAGNSEIEQAGKTAFPENFTLVSGDVEPLKIKNRGATPIVLISCVLYSWKGESETHKTGVVFALKDINTQTKGVFKNVATIEDFDAGGYAD